MGAASELIQNQTFYFFDLNISLINASVRIGRTDTVIDSLETIENMSGLVNEITYKIYNNNFVLRYNSLIKLSDILTNIPVHYPQTK